MKTYSSEDADYLIGFYRKKLVGENICQVGKYKIISLEKEQICDDLFLINAVSRTKYDIIELKHNINVVAEQLGILPPELALHQRNKN